MQPLLCLVNILVTQLQQEAFIEQSRQMQRETEDLWHPCDNYTSVSICVIYPLSLINKSPVGGFWKEGDFSESGYFLAHISTSL